MISAPKVVGLQVGQTRTVTLLGRRITTASFKVKASSPVAVGPSGLVGDEQADLRVHGGPDKAVCFYPFEHYSYWTDVLDQELPRGAFGENVTTRGMLESNVHVGDTWLMGSVTIQVSSPRRPCWKLGARWSMRELPRLVQITGYTGFYCRVLDSGSVSPGDPFKLIDRLPHSMSVGELNRVMNVDRDDVVGISHALAAPGLPRRWRKTLEARLTGVSDSDHARLFGGEPAEY